MSAHQSRARRGMTIIEVMFAIVILAGVMLAMSRFGQAFTRAARDAANIAVASDLAAARVEAIRGHAAYASIVATYHGTTETATTSGANPPMTGHSGFTRTTSAARTLTDTTDYVTVTVEVNAAVLSKPLRKTAVIAAFR
jgi:prepilin-type N-terminal cleavage/methylation domain-containing protein